MYVNSRSRRQTSSFAPVQLSIERNPLGDTRVHFSVRPSALIALIAAVLLHLLTVYLIMRPKDETAKPIGAEEPISVRLIEPEAPVAKAPPREPAVAPTPPPPKPRVKPKVKPREKAEKPRKPAAAPPDVLRVPDTQPAPPPRPTINDAPTDMMSFVNRQRERRRVAEASEGRERATGIAREQGPSADETAAAIIKRNLQQQGASGVFQITRKGVRLGAFLFRGWTTDASNARREFIEIDAGLNGDIERAMIRRMIELIRRYYTGNFNWESRRLGRTVILSAAPENNAELEDFLIQEFFRVGANYPP